MKRIFLIISMLTVGVSFGSLKAQEKAKWKEMDTFHEVMAKTFHPAEEGKLDPIKARSGEMLQKAIAWQDSEPPKGYDKKAVKKYLDELVDGARNLDKMVREKATDDELKSKLSELHDIFHHIMEKCEKDDLH